MNKKRILFITPSLCQGGLEHSLITMLKLLDENKYDMYLYTYGEDLSLLPLVPKYVQVKNDLLNKHYQRNPKAISLWIKEMFFKKVGAKEKAKLYFDQRQRYKHKQKVNQINKSYAHYSFDVVVANSIGMTSEMAACVKASKRYAFFRSSVDLHHELNVELFPLFDGIIAVSQGVKDMLCSSYKDVENKVYVLENYVDAEQIISKANEFIPEEIVEKKDKTIISTCGRFSQEKGFDLAVESARELKTQGYDFLWFFIGDGAQRESLEHLIETYNLKNDIIITGYKENPFPYIKCCDIYVQPSYHESYGRTIKEAVILGKPVVSTDTVGGHTVLEEGKYGEIVSFDPKDIAKGIRVAEIEHYPKYSIDFNIIEKRNFVYELESILSK